MEKNEYTVMYSVENDFWWYRGLHELVESEIAQFSKQSNKPILLFDAGCGTGRMMEIAGKYGTVSGIDYSSEAIAYCKERSLFGAVQLDLNDWQPAENSYDVIYSLDVLCHSAIKDLDVVFERMYKALNPGGLLILNLPAFEALRRMHDKAVFTKQRFTNAPVIKQLQSHGFSLVFSSYRLPLFFFVIFGRKILESLFRYNSVHSDLAQLPVWLNTLLLCYNRFDNFFLKRRFPLILGSSLYLVAQKPETV
jgi:SAM-dependent methyltransferase